MAGSSDAMTTVLTDTADDRRTESGARHWCRRRRPFDRALFAACGQTGSGDRSVGSRRWRVIWQRRHAEPGYRDADRHAGHAAQGAGLVTRSAGSAGREAILFSARIAMAAAMGEGRPPRSRAGSVRRNAGVAPRNAGLLARTAR